MLKVYNIFGPTIQGEGPLIGKKCIFIRFFGCDYNCSFCDQKMNSKKYVNMTVEKIILNIKYISKNIKDIIFTGGNPCIQNENDMLKLVNLLNKENYRINVETQGSIWSNWMSHVYLIVVSPKLYCFDNYFFYNTFFLNYMKYRFGVKLCIKIVIFSNRDINKQLSKVKYIKNIYSKFNILFYISIGNRFTKLKNKNKGTLLKKLLLDYNLILNYILKDEELQDIFILPQMHVLLWGRKDNI